MTDTQSGDMIQPFGGNMDKKNIVCTSSILGEDMHVVAYGKKGLPVVVLRAISE